MPKFRFTQLRVLHEDMLQQGETRDIFPFTFKKGKGFSCIFITDICPYRLYVTAVGDMNLSFVISIESNYEASTFLENDKYHALCEYLELKFNPEHRFIPTDFFEALNRNIPDRFNERPSYKDILRVNAGNNVENRDADNFCGWRRSPTGRVTPDNLEKTRRAFGDEYAEMSKEKGISSCWTANDNEEDLNRLNEIVAMQNR